PVLLAELLDLQEPAYGEVDDRRRDVESVGLLVEQSADLARSHLVRRRELDRGRRGVDEGNRLVGHLLTLRRLEPRHLPDVAPVAAPGPEDPADPAEQTE